MLSRVTLEVVVVGASIAGELQISLVHDRGHANPRQGLATAFTLQRAGHNVLVVESQSGRQMTVSVYVHISLPLIHYCLEFFRNTASMNCH